MFRVTEEILAASAPRTSTLTGSDQFNPDPRGDIELIEVILDLTAFVTAASLIVSIEGYLEAPGAYRTILASASITGNGTTRLVLGPLVPAATNASATGPVPNRYRVVVTHGNGNSHTYSVTIRRVRQG